MWRAVFTGASFDLNNALRFSGRTMQCDTDYILTECPLAPLKALVEALEQDYEIKVAKEPSVCLTMVRAEDSLEKQEFYLGEALTTECEVSVNGLPGFGLCLGEEPVRCYCIGVLDAIAHGNANDSRIQAFLEEQSAVVERRDRDEYARALSTRVDFKLMEED